MKNLISTKNPIPILRGTAKDHKVPKNPERGHDLRPIMTARVGPNTSLAQIGSRILKVIADNVKEDNAIKSTEELLRKFEDYNRKIQVSNSHSGKTVFSMDIKSFYPSLNPKRAAQVARIMWMRSNLDLEIDEDLLAKYVGKFCEPEKILEENLTEFVYTKRSKKEVQETKEKIHENLNLSATNVRTFCEANIVRDSTSNIDMELNAENVNKFYAAENTGETTENVNMHLSAENVRKFCEPEVLSKKKTAEEIENEKWAKPEKLANKQIIKKLFGIALERLIIFTMENHIYQFDNENRLQSSGGATGLDATGEVADLYMLWWDCEFLKVLKSVNIELDIHARFKDDINDLCDELNEKNDVIEKIWKLDFMKHKAKPILDANYTANVLCLIANGIDPMISFTVDTCNLNSDKKLPMLDVKVYLDQNQKLVHEHFEKPTKNRRVILADSALSWSQKPTIHTQECLRILRNTSVLLGEQIQNKHLSNYMKKLMLSGYSAKFRGEVICSAKNAYKSLISLHEGGKNMYRNRAEMLECKSVKKKGKENWWQSEVKGKKPFTSILFVPPTPRGVLAKMLKKREIELTRTVK